MFSLCALCPLWFSFLSFPRPPRLRVSPMAPDGGRAQCVSRKVKTDFGAMYLHVDLDARGRPVGGAISSPGKEPDSAIARLVAALSEALDDALAAPGREAP